MPLYEYECKNCKFRIEKIQKVNDPPLQFCSRCNGQLKKVISSPNIRFKGSGWYVTDYAKRNIDDIKSSGDVKEGKSKSSSPDKENQQSSINNSSPPCHTSPDKSSLP
jgi:putative FmdB family regulatory protein